MAFRRTCFALALLAGGASATASLADHAPSYVIPDRRGVPLHVDGVDVSGSVIEGDWGLSRAGAVAPTIYPNYSAHGPVLLAPPAGYYPQTGRRPRYGREEAPSRRGLPAPAESYSRSWSAGSGSNPATVYAPFDPPEVIEAVPRPRRSDRWPRRPRRLP
ncbi:MAG: hypothetical protein C0522_12750 [Rhodocyclaceae bacterium]|nr:hypothetical protein [Rhodocyclaceae bacterium]